MKVRFDVLPRCTEPVRQGRQASILCLGPFSDLIEAALLRFRIATKRVPIWMRVAATA